MLQNIYNIKWIIASILSIKNKIKLPCVNLVFIIYFDIFFSIFAEAP